MSGVAGAAFWSGVVLVAVEELAAFDSLGVVTPLLLLVDGVGWAVLEAAFWSEVAAELLAEEGAAVWSGVLLVAAVEPEPTVLEGVWLLTGGVVAALFWLVAAVWSVELAGGVFMLLDEPLLEALAAVVSAEVPVEDWLLV